MRDRRNVRFLHSEESDWTPSGIFGSGATENFVIPREESGFAGQSRFLTGKGDRFGMTK
jgi:hypothetical protein